MPDAHDFSSSAGTIGSGFSGLGFQVWGSQKKRFSLRIASIQRYSPQASTADARRALIPKPSYSGPTLNPQTLNPTPRAFKSLPWGRRTWAKELLERPRLCCNLGGVETPTGFTLSHNWGLGFRVSGGFKVQGQLRCCQDLCILSPNFHGSVLLLPFGTIA